MTNRTDLDKFSAQIELVKQLLGPETFDLKKILIELETKKKLLMKFKPRSYDTILKGLESGVLKHPGDWVFEEKKVETPEGTKSRRLEEEKKTTVEAEKARKEVEEKAILEKELQDTKDKLAELEALKELEKEAEADIIEEEKVELGE